MLIVNSKRNRLRQCVVAQHLEHLRRIIVKYGVLAVNLIVGIIEVISQTPCVCTLLLLKRIAGQQLPSLAHSLGCSQLNPVVMVGVELGDVGDQVIG